MSKLPVWNSVNQSNIISYFARQITGILPSAINHTMMVTMMIQVIIHHKLHIKVIVFFVHKIAKFLIFINNNKQMFTCVVLPEPVSPTSTRHWFLFNVSTNLSLYSQTGSVVRFLYNSQYLGENGNPRT